MSLHTDWRVWYEAGSLLAWALLMLHSYRNARRWRALNRRLDEIDATVTTIEEPLLQAVATAHNTPGTQVIVVCDAPGPAGSTVEIWAAIYAIQPQPQLRSQALQHRKATHS